MEDEACLFNKFGYCKFKLNCKRIHYWEICQENKTCEAKIECKKRHPKNARNIKHKKVVDLELTAAIYMFHIKAKLSFCS